MDRHAIYKVTDKKRALYNTLLNEVKIDVISKHKITYLFGILPKQAGSLKRAELEVFSEHELAVFVEKVINGR